MTTPPLSHRVHTILTTAAAVLDLPLDPRHVEALAVHLTPAVRALLAEAATAAADSAPVRYAVARDLTSSDAPAEDVAVTVHDGVVCRIQADVDLDAPAAVLAHDLRTSQPDVTVTDIPSPVYLGITVQPQSLTAWNWWLTRLGIRPDSVTVHDDDAYGTGESDGVSVAIAGDGVGRLIRETSGRPAWDPEHDTPAGTVAARARRQPDVTAIELRNATTIALTVAPPSLMEWQWWLHRLSIAPDSVAFDAGAVVAEGRADGATVHLRGDGCRGYYADEAAARLAGLLAPGRAVTGPATTAQWLTAAGIGTGSSAVVLAAWKVALDAVRAPGRSRLRRTAPARPAPAATAAVPGRHARPAAADETQPITCLQPVRARHTKGPAWT